MVIIKRCGWIHLRRKNLKFSGIQVWVGFQQNGACEHRVKRGAIHEDYDSKPGNQK